MGLNWQTDTGLWWPRQRIGLAALWPTFRQVIRALRPAPAIADPSTRWPPVSTGSHRLASDARRAETRDRIPPTTMADADVARFHASMLPHLDAAHTLARYLSRDADAAEDIVQDAYLKAFRAFGTFRDGDSRAWILAIVRNCCRTWRAERQRRSGRTVEPPPDPDDADLDPIATLASEADSAETGLIRADESAAVRQVLETLAEPLREVLVLRELEGQSYRAIATIADLPIGTVMSRLARARAAFATQWLRLERRRNPSP